MCLTKLNLDILAMESGVADTKPPSRTPISSINSAPVDSMALHRSFSAPWSNWIIVSILSEVESSSMSSDVIFEWSGADGSAVTVKEIDVPNINATSSNETRRMVFGRVRLSSRLLNAVRMPTIVG